MSKYELYVSRIDGTGRNRIGEGFRQPQFRRDGNMLVVNGDGAPNYEHLVKMNPGGDERVEISNHGEDSFPTWPPDLGANLMAFSSTAEQDRRSRIGVVETLGKVQDWIPPVNVSLAIQGRYPFWMDNHWIVYEGCDFWASGTACGLFKVREDGSGTPQRLTDHPSDTAPAGYGTNVVFMSSRDGNWEVYTINIDGSGLKRLTNSNAQEGLPTWSPDGKAIAFVSNRGGAWAIWAMEADGSTQRKLFDLEGGYGSGEYAWTNERISWAP